MKAINVGADFEPQQAVIDFEAIADDPDVVKLLDEVRLLLASNKELAAQVETLQKQSKSRDTISIGK
ncbi:MULTISPECIES: hypothetical protein [Pseudanabaena]|uniref:hypothetical protein n=1 Tax=Pseudanabaena TaxID=1152 RepID=UPI00247916C1|nr:MULTISPECIES: hypothetical protein [Pseudanabaena]MEA5486377.1 hypothetical protein [Pseudanabaena sp. CCNP1317]WGS71475.1 hypothetical protein OA858_17415 [Pseudanabaena galeata CCNP1313]